MIKVSEYDAESDSLYDVSIEDMNFNRLKWLDCHNPTKEELQKIKFIIGIPDNDMEQCIDEDERPAISEIDNFSMIIFKSPFKDHKNISVSSFAILISRNLLITIRKKDVECVKKILQLNETTKKRFFSKGSTYLVYQIIESVIDDYFKILDDIEKDIDLIENSVFHNPDKKTVMEIFLLKKNADLFSQGIVCKQRGHPSNRQ